MIVCEVLFYTNKYQDIKYIHLPAPPQIGDKIEIDFSFFDNKFDSDTGLIVFEITDIEWVIKGGHFERLSIYVKNNDD